MAFQGSRPTWFSLLLVLACGPDPEVFREDTTPAPAAVSTESWYEGALDPASSPVDLRFLNPLAAGERGFVRVDGERLVFDDGTEARFWGCNVQASALFDTSDEQIRRHAERLSRLGFNLVRLHHTDAMRWVQPCVIDAGPDHTHALDPAAMARLDLWIAALSENGIYVWLDLHNGRVFKPGDDIPGFSEIAQEPDRAHGRGFCYVNDRLLVLMTEMGRKLLDHVNPLRERAWRDDPALVGFTVTNENALGKGLARRLTDDDLYPWHALRFLSRARGFARATGVDETELLDGGHSAPSRLLLAELEHRFQRRFIDAVGWPADRPWASTSYWGHAKLWNLPPLTAGTVIDAHSYGVEGELGFDPRLQATFLSWIGPAQVAGHPTFVSEWNLSEPLVEDRFTAPLWVAGTAALQGWDALMLYGYAQRDLGAKVPLHDASPWTSFTDPAVMGLMPAAALMFRRGDVEPALTTWWVPLDRDTVWTQRTAPDRSPALRSLVEQGRMVMGLPNVPELEWDESVTPPADARTVGSLADDHLPGGAVAVASDTGQLRREWAVPLYTVDTPRTQAATGALGGRSLAFTDVTLEVRTDWGTVAVSSLDGEPLADSGDILITAVGRARPSSGGGLPYRSEPIEVTVLLTSERDDLRLVSLDAAGAAAAVDLPGRADGTWTLELPTPSGTHWYRLQPAATAPSQSTGK